MSTRPLPMGYLKIWFNVYKGPVVEDCKDPRHKYKDQNIQFGKWSAVSDSIIYP